MAEVHQVLGAALATAYRRHIDDTDPVTDAPTIRCLRRILTDYEPILEWAEATVAAYAAGRVEEAGLAMWRWHLQRLLASIGGVTGSDERAQAPAPLRTDTKPFARGTVPLRDCRFDTFKNTGDYDAADTQERFPKDSYESLRQVGVDDLSHIRGQPVALAFYPASWSPVCGGQMALYDEILPEFQELGDELLGISVDGVWCHTAFSRDRKLHFPLLAEFEPKGAAFIGRISCLARAESSDRITRSQSALKHDVENLKERKEFL